MQPTLLKIVNSNPIRIQPWFFKKGLKEKRMEMPKSNGKERESVQDQIFDRLSQSISSSHLVQVVSPTIQDPGLKKLRRNIEELEILQSRLDYMMVELEGLLKKI